MYSNAKRKTKLENTIYLGNDTTLHQLSVNTLDDTEKLLSVTTFNTMGNLLYKGFQKRRKKKQIKIFTLDRFHDWTHLFRNMMVSIDFQVLVFIIILYNYNTLF